MLKNVRNVFIDLDDTLWDFTSNASLSLKHVYESNGINDYCPEYDLFRQIYLDKNNELWELYHYGKITKSYLITERFRYTLEQINYKGGDADETAAKINDEYLDFLARQTTLVPGAKELLEYLTERFKVSIVSNGFKGVQLKKLQSGGIDGYIDKLILSDDAGITKPNRGIFDFALNLCDAKAETSLMIGDNYDADINGAHNAGWMTIHFNVKNDAPENSVADATVKRLTDIKGLF